MKVLHITEPRCAGRDLKIVPTICPQRSSCHRHLQLDIDRQIGVMAPKVMNLPYVAGQACHYRLKT
jgi:hypothetical protein